jgi:hypothetical protein
MTTFKRQTDLRRSSGLRLSTPVRSLVERVAEEAGITYSDAIRLLVEEALAHRAGLGGSGREIVTALTLLNTTTKLWQEALQRDQDTMKEIRNETARILYQLSGWPVASARRVDELGRKLDLLLAQLTPEP